MTDQTIRVGLSIVILNPQGKILAGKRKAQHGFGTWGLAGGHLEFGETFEEGAIRETLEEVGLELRDIEILCTTNNFFDNRKKHYVTIFLIGHVSDDPPQILEPDKVETWEYFDSLYTLPQPHFLPYAEDIDQQLIEAYAEKYL